MSKTEATRLYGPSYADGRRPFAEVFGSDDELLAIQNQLLENMR